MQSTVSSILTGSTAFFTLNGVTVNSTRAGNESSVALQTRPKFLYDLTVLKCYVLAPIGLLTNLFVLFLNLKAGKPFSLQRRTLLYLGGVESVLLLLIIAFLSGHVTFYSQCLRIIWNSIVFPFIYSILYIYFVFGLDLVLLVYRPLKHRQMTISGKLRFLPDLCWLLALCECVSWWVCPLMKSQGDITLACVECDVLLLRVKSFEFMAFGAFMISAILAVPAAVGARIRSSQRQSRNLQGEHKSLIQRTNKRAKRCMITLLLLVISFSVSSIPLSILTGIYVNPEGHRKVISAIGLDYLRLSFSITETLLIGGFSLDPIIYGTRTAIVKQEFLKLYRKKSRKSIYLNEVRKRPVNNETSLTESGTSQCVNESHICDLSRET